MRSKTDTLYFVLKPDLSGFEHTSKDLLDGVRIPLEHLIGDTLAHIFCDLDSPLVHVTLHRYGLGEEIIVRKRLNDIKVIIIRKAHETSC